MYQLHDNPLISVLLIVYSDSPLYREALDSVASQFLPTGEFEVVIASSFSQEFEIPRVLEKDTNVKVVESKQLTSGGKIREGVRSCNGKIVAFLDYDDLWESGRLSAIVKAFSEADGLGYYHNDCTFVWGDQESRKGVYRSLASSHLSTKTETKILRPSTSTPAEMIRWMGPGTYNMSSVAVLRDTLLSFSDKIPNVNLSIEDIIFYNCLSLNMNCMRDSMKLTRVRMHGSNVSNASNRSRNTEQERMAIESLKELMRATPSKVVNASLKAYIPSKELYSKFSIEFAGRAKVARQLLSYLGNSQRSGMFPDPVLTGMAAGYLLSPSIYTRLLNKRFG